VRVPWLVCGLLVVSLAWSCGDDSSGGSGGGANGSSGSSGSNGSSGGSSGSNGSSGSSSDGTSGGSSGSSSDGTAADACVNAINGYRKEQGLAPLARWSDVEACSDGEAQSDGSSNKPHGAFPKCGENAQNECPNWPGPAASMIPKCLDAMWKMGPGEGHHDNMASTKWTKVACGFYTLPNGSVWSVQNFR